MIIAGFQATYAIGLLGSGPLIDRIGTRLGYALAVGICSVAAVAHGFVRSVAGFGSVRLLLGLGESGKFPCAVKATSEWFPVSAHAFAVGLFNSGSTVGAIVAPLVVPWIALTLGWRAAFMLIGLLGFIWIPAWLILLSPPVTRAGRCGRAQNPIRCRHSHAPPARASRNAGHSYRPLDHGAGVVVLSLLGAEILERKPRVDAAQRGAAADGDIWHRQSGRSVWRLALFDVYQARMDGKCGAQMRCVGLCSPRGAGGVRQPGASCMGSCRHPRVGDGRTPGLGVESVCYADRYISQAGGGIGYWFHHMRQSKRTCTAE